MMILKCAYCEQKFSLSDEVTHLFSYGLFHKEDCLIEFVYECLASHTFKINDLPNSLFNHYYEKYQKEQDWNNEKHVTQKAKMKQFRNSANGISYKLK